jgi:NAD(P)-dependent dehydrogenase (short-subunit alcohol dehydrogenase family)
MNLGLKGESVIITGASKGIGWSIALGFAEKGANVAMARVARMLRKRPRRS